MEQIKKQFQFYLYNKPTLVIIDWFSLYNRYNNIDLQNLFNYLKSYKDIYQIRFYHGTIKDKQWSVDVKEEAEQIGYKVITKFSKKIKIEIKKEKHLESILSKLQDLLDDISDKNSDIANQIYTIKNKVKEKIAEVSETDDIFTFIDEIDQRLKDLGLNINIFKNELEKPIKKTKCDFDAEIAKDIVLEIDKYENLILFSGDGDFAPIVDFLIKEREKRVFVIYPQGSFGEIDYQNFQLITRLEDNRREYINGLVCRPADHILQYFIKKEPADFSAGPDANNISDSD